MNLLLSSVSESTSSPLCNDEEDDDLLRSQPSGGSSMSFSLSADSVASLSTSPGVGALSSVDLTASGCWSESREDEFVWPWLESLFTSKALGSIMRLTSNWLFAATSPMLESTLLLFTFKKGAIQQFTCQWEWLQGRVGPLNVRIWYSRASFSPWSDIKWPYNPQHLKKIRILIMN